MMGIDSDDVESDEVLLPHIRSQAYICVSALNCATTLGLNLVRFCRLFSIATLMMGPLGPELDQAFVFAFISLREVASGIFSAPPSFP